MAGFSDVIDISSITPAHDATEVGGQDQIVYPLIPQPSNSEWTNNWLAYITINGTSVYTASKAGGIGYRSFRLSLYADPVPIVGPAIDWSTETTYTHQIQIYVTAPPYSTDSPHIGNGYSFTTDRPPTAPSNIVPASGATGIGDQWDTATSSWTLWVSYSTEADIDNTGIWWDLRAVGNYYYGTRISGLSPLTTYTWKITIRRNWWDYYTGVMTFTTADTPPSGGGGLPGAGIGEVSQDDATPTEFPAIRPPDYNPDDVWIENAWEDINGVDAFAGGGRWNTQLFFVGKGVIYFEELS